MITAAKALPDAAQTANLIALAIEFRQVEKNSSSFHLFLFLELRASPDTFCVCLLQLLLGSTPTPSPTGSESLSSLSNLFKLTTVVSKLS